ncbi:MAG: hypothetical protein RL425_740 [Pseudomonadota bacterium]|jgi:hypothetical protein
MLMLIALLSALTAPSPGELKSYGDWTIGCDNGRACRAVSLMEMETSENQLTLQIFRGPLAADLAQIRIANIEKREPGQTVRIVLDGQTTVATIKFPANGEALALPLDQKLADKFRSGRRLELRDAGDVLLGNTSLNGFAEALGEMDARQSRSNTVTALAQIGPLPAANIPAPPVLPVVLPKKPPRENSLKLTPDETKRLLSMGACDVGDETPIATDAVRLDGKTWLGLIPCAMGSYNILTAPVLISGQGKARKAKRAEFDFLPSASTSVASPLLANASWDPMTGELTSYAKGRGLGDCGTTETYVWDGRRFRLITQFAMGECRGVLDWIPTWRAKVRRR